MFSSSQYTGSTVSIERRTYAMRNSMVRLPGDVLEKSEVNRASNRSLADGVIGHRRGSTNWSLNNVFSSSQYTGDAESCYRALIAAPTPEE